MRSFIEIYRALAEVYGPQNWWPIWQDGRSLYLPEYLTRKRSPDEAFEIAIGAILTQNTAWSNVEKALANLKSSDILSIEGLNAANDSTVAECVKPSGYFNQKTKKIRAFLHFILERLAGDFMLLRDYPVTEGRQMLLSVWGIGKETADSILLYSFGLPVFVVDAYTRRILERLDHLDGSALYDIIRLALEKNLPHDAILYQEFHALLVKHAVTACRKKPLCETCLFSKTCPFAKNALHKAH